MKKVKKLSIKIIIVGEPAVGKTSLVKKFVSGQFAKDYRSSIGTNIFIKKVNIKNIGRIRIQLWDIAGQERWINMRRSYYVGAKEPNFLGIPLVWSPGLPTNTMVCGVKSNFLLLTDLLDDYESVTVVPQWNVAAVDTLRIAGRFKFGVDYLIGSEIVYYTF